MPSIRMQGFLYASIALMDHGGSRGTRRLGTTLLVGAAAETCKKPIGMMHPPTVPYSRADAIRQVNDKPRSPISNSCEYTMQAHPAGFIRSNESIARKDGVGLRWIARNGLVVVEGES